MNLFSFSTSAKLVVVSLLTGLLLGILPGFELGKLTYKAEAKSLETELANLKEQHAAALAQANIKALERVTAEQARGNSLSEQLAQAESTIRNQSQELKRALKQTTFDRPCLGMRTVRLLNNALGGGVANLPATTGKPFAENEPTATDTDIAEWASTAIEEYETCRVRLEKLIDFERGREGKPNE